MPRYHHAHPVIVWFRRDLRLQDNLALHAAVGSRQPVICVYIRENDADHPGALGAAQAWWLHHSLEALDQALQKAGNKLVRLSGNPLAVLEHLVDKTGAKAIHWNRRYDADGIAQDAGIEAQCRQKGIDAGSFAGFLMHEPSKLLNRQDKHYSVFTPFWKAFEASFHPLDPLPAPQKIAAPDTFPRSEALQHWNLLPKKPDWAKGFSDQWTPGERGAHVRLDAFLDEAVAGYRENRDIPARRGSSRLSPHLAMGEISPHRIWHATSALFHAGESQDAGAFRRQLAWREFSWHLLFHKPDMPCVNLDRRFDAFEWHGDMEKLHAWRRGMTGYPVVDAGMRELWQTGFMHNRVRMIAASFLIKDLLIDWRQGERWFRDTLVDIDCANNAMNWQWVAGCGADASPWFRIFNPVKQGETFDRGGAYVRRYCPELAALPDKYIHAPSEAPQDVLAKAGVTLGKNYPRSIVAHDEARERALEAFKSLPKTNVS